MANEEYRVLSVEDDEFITLFLTDVMWIFGTADNIKLINAATTEKAMEIVKNPVQKPQLILLDLALPEKTGDPSDPEHGFRFLELLKTDPALIDIKVLVFAGSTDPQYKKRALRLGADKFLVKGDYLPKELIEVVREALYITPASSAFPPQG
ncbi:MAG: response regulator [Patescibacteria group bacterium]